MSASPAVRSLRAAVFAAVCVLLAAAGHGLAMGHMPPARIDAAGFLGVFTLGWLLGGRERTLPGIGVAMLATQAGLHFAFDAAHRAAPMSGHAMAAMHGHALAGMAGPHAVAEHVTAAHILAALVASWWLRRGEAALFSLLRRAVALVPRLVAWWRGVPLPALLDGPLRAQTDPGAPRLLPLRHAVHRRGPPARIPYPI